MWFSFFFIGFFALLLASIFLFFQLRNTRKKDAKTRKEHEHKLFELTLLNEISDKIGYSLDTKDIGSTIASSAERIFEISSFSFAAIENDHIEITTNIHENFPTSYLEKIKEVMIEAIVNVDEQLSKRSVSHKIASPIIDKSTPAGIQVIAAPSSYFNIPLVLNNRFTGIITITSKNPNAFKEEDMTMLYNIVNRIQLTLSRLEIIIAEEKGKVESLVKSLSSGEMFFILRYDSLQLYTINPAALRFLEITQQDPDIISVLSKFKLKPNIIAEMKDVITQKKSTFYRNTLIYDKRFNVYITPVFGHTQGSIIGVALTMQDITHELEIQKIREGFTNMMVHELRAPLTAIKGAADLLLNGTTSEDDQLKMRLVIKNSSSRLLGDIDDMLDSARIGAGKLLVHKVESNINEVIAKVLEEATYTAQTKSILIEKHLDADIPSFLFDPVRIGQVVTNLLSNSIKYSDPHTVIEVYSRVREGFVEVEVKDHGSGIDKEVIEKLFQPFAQGNFIKKAKGTGLGLYVTKNIITEHGGKIWVESEVGQGTSVLFRLSPVHEVILQTKASVLN